MWCGLPQPPSTSGYSKGLPLCSRARHPDAHTQEAGWPFVEAGACSGHRTCACVRECPCARSPAEVAMGLAWRLGFGDRGWSLGNIAQGTGLP